MAGILSRRRNCGRSGTNPRLAVSGLLTVGRSSSQNGWAVLLLFIPLGPLVMFIICVVGIGGPIPTPLGVGWPLPLPFVADVLARYPAPPERDHSPLVV